MTVPPILQYAFFGRTDAGFLSTMFHSAPKAVQDAAVKLHYPDPCGDNYSLIDTIQKQAANDPKVTVPVLVACGRNDVLYAGFGCEAQADRFKKGSVLLLKKPVTVCPSNVVRSRSGSGSTASSTGLGSSFSGPDLRART